MSSYAGRHAELYDLFYAGKPYAEEAAFVHACLRKFALFPIRDILELACGTGRHAFQLEKLGYRMTATDYSPEMLGVARRRATETGSNVRFVASDMRELQVPTVGYDAVICLFDSIGYLQTHEAVNQMFAGVLDVKASSGNPRLGGADFDRLLVEDLAARIAREHGLDVAGDARALARLKIAAAVRLFRYLYVLGGFDDAFNSRVASAGGTGRDYFLGATLRFNDEDLRSLLILAGGSLTAATQQ